MKSYVQSGKQITVPAPADTLSGAFVLLGALFGVAAYSVLAGADLELTTGGVYDQPKAAGQAWTVGQALYWDAANKVFTTTAAANTKVGVAVLPAAAGDVSGRVRLNASF